MLTTCLRLGATSEPVESLTLGSLTPCRFVVGGVFVRSVTVVVVRVGMSWGRVTWGVQICLLLGLN